MRLSWKRNILGNLVALSLCCSLLAGYITLLRYNKASGTTFNLVSKRRSHRVIREVDSGHAAWKSGHFGNHQMKPGKKDTKRWRQSPLEVFIVEEHHEGTNGKKKHMMCTCMLLCFAFVSFRSLDLANQSTTYPTSILQGWLCMFSLSLPMHQSRFALLVPNVFFESKVYIF